MSTWQDCTRPAGEHGASVVSIFDASRAYGVASTSDADVNPRADGTPLVALAGKDYGMGSSRDWAAAFTAATWWAWACFR